MSQANVHLRLSPATAPNSRGPVALGLWVRCWGVSKVLTLLAASLLPGCHMVKPGPMPGLREVQPTVKRAAAAEARGDWKDAEHTLREGLRQHPDNPDLRWELVKLLQEQGRQDEASEHLRVLVENDPDDIRGYLRLAQTWYEQHRYGDADRLISLALERDPQLYEALLMKAQLYEIWGDSPRALQCYYRALAHERHGTAAALRIAELHLEQQETAVAIPLLRKLSRCPELPLAERQRLQWQLGLAYGQLGRWDNAAEELAQANPQTPEQIYALAYARHRNGNDAQARTELAGLLSKHPRYAPAQTLWNELPPLPGEGTRPQILPAGHAGPGPR